MGKGWQQPKAQFGTHKGGAGGYYGQVTPPRGGDVVDGIQRGMGHLTQGIENFASQQLEREKMDLTRQKFGQDMEVAQQKMNISRENNELNQLKFAASEKQQDFQNDLKMKDDARKQVKTQLEMTDFKNKEEVATIFRNNIGVVTETLEKGTYEDLLNSDEYQTMLSGLAAVDPEGALKMTNDVLTKRAKEKNDKKASATYALTTEIYTTELPEAINMIEQGSSIPEAMEGIRLKISNLYKNGNVDHKAMTDQLKAMMTLLKSYKTKSGSAPLVSFDSQGNQIDPMIDPGAVTKQVNADTGKVSSIKQPGKSIFEELGIDMTDLGE